MTTLRERLDALAATDHGREEFKRMAGDAVCPNCPHPIAEHCSRHTPKGGGRTCCPGYCFAGDDCDCVGYAHPAKEIVK